MPQHIREKIDDKLNSFYSNGRIAGILISWGLIISAFTWANSDADARAIFFFLGHFGLLIFILPVSVLLLLLKGLGNRLKAGLSNTSIGGVALGKTAQERFDKDKEGGKMCVYCGEIVSLWGAFSSCHRSPHKHHQMPSGLGVCIFCNTEIDNWGVFSSCHRSPSGKHQG